MADLDTIMSERPADQPAEQTRDDGRDEQGRFASQQPAPEAPQAPAAEPQPQEQQPVNPLDGYVPIQTLDARLAKQEEKLRRDFAAEMQQRLAQLQPQKPAEPVKQPDYYEDPQAAVDFRLQQAIQPVQQGQRDIVENFSKMMASDKFGEEAVNAAEAELRSRVASDPRGTLFDYQRIMASPHPYGELVKWHKAQAALKTYGDDPEAAINAEVERRLAERNGQPQSGQQAPTSQTPPVMPTSFAGSRNAGPNSAPGFSGPRPLSEIMGGR
ncbi:hypothetical protein [Bradyrhizobium sp.]|uniref:hypothetical protein n=1 Tax=Bradyrhizobium sp. TaxID=376 RepID=UPI0025BF4E42|nr:hypothetical protein [Bradyrhizobium sp.]